LFARARLKSGNGIHKKWAPRAHFAKPGEMW
jgi:hypothetical protein